MNNKSNKLGKDRTKMEGELRKNGKKKKAEREEDEKIEKEEAERKLMIDELAKIVEEERARKKAENAEARRERYKRKTELKAMLKYDLEKEKRMKDEEESERLKNMILAKHPNQPALTPSRCRSSREIVQFATDQLQKWHKDYRQNREQGPSASTSKDPSPIIDYVGSKPPSSEKPQILKRPVMVTAARYSKYRVANVTSNTRYRYVVRNQGSEEDQRSEPVVKRARPLEPLEDNKIEDESVPANPLLPESDVFEVKEEIVEQQPVAQPMDPMVEVKEEVVEDEVEKEPLMEQEVAEAHEQPAAQPVEPSPPRNADYMEWTVDEMAEWVMAVTNSPKTRDIIRANEVSGKSMKIFLTNEYLETMKIPVGPWILLKDAAKLIMEHRT